MAQEQPTQTASAEVFFDIAIIGGGMVGASLAALLAASGANLRIALIEAQPFAPADQAHFQPSFDARSTALSYGSVEILRELNLWPQLSEHVTAIRRVHVSDRGHFGGGMINAAEHQLDAVGYVVENAWLGRVLLQNLQAQTAIQCFAPAQVTRLTPLQNGALLQLDCAGKTSQIRTSLAVIADGGDSPLRQSLGISSRIRAYHQSAIITNVEFSEAHQGIAYERFTDSGPMALLPLGESDTACHAALVWTLPSEQAEAMMALDDEAFLAALQQRFGFRQGRFVRVAKRFAYPLELVLAEEQVRSHIVLVGNAAHFLHPVAGQGFNLALRDCTALVEQIVQACKRGENPGSLAVLQAYVAQQQLDQSLTVEFSDRLVRLFSSQQLPLIALRHLGFISLAALPFAKREFSRQTMGTGGRRYRWQLESRSSPAEDPALAEPMAANYGALDKQVDFDLTIVGAGLVGASLACAVAQLPGAQSLRIAVVEASGPPEHFAGKNFDPRVVALTAASQELLARIGCWEAIATQRVCAYRQMKVWDGEGTAAITFDAADVRQPQLGHIVENSVLVNALRTRMAQLKNIQLIQPETISNLQKQTANRVQLELGSGKRISTSLLIAADGARSKVRELAGFETREWDYGHTAIVTTVRTEKAHEFTAWQRFMHTGPLAFLPLVDGPDDHHCSIVWSAEVQLAEQLMSLDDASFCRQLGEAFEYRLGAIEAVAERFAIPLRQRHAKNYRRPGIVLVGDAAHNIHPLAGQGVNLGLLDVAELSAQIQRALERNIPLVDASILQRYQRARLAGNLGMMSAMETFKQLFGSRSLAVNWLRNTGMRQVDSLGAVKKWIVRAALGSR